jgi:hypothetical protein
VKFGNGGLGNGCGKVELIVDGSVAWSGEKACVIRHSGWFYRAHLKVDFIDGSVRATERGCGLPTDCMN